ncbi:biotin-dependent carboxyltransferase [Siminovitchia acidinfaciens]|uniref:Biotin-dependent carboxyltransferase n=1 Tax=Siminovitchia acidinfaciens TaxID=2321395 RepID=A0A429XWD7_9BACI|nr:biotin-dependent carboxyltransferase family protein [Siminovitchia acidinfaciens]RST72703.1 biotin-dependent carboxyltransferase [Siminovitchia acidinfaciens]
MIEIIEPGLWSTVQDLGRLGNYHLGVPPSGAADKYSFMAGNLLVGNPVDFAGLEMTLFGGKMCFHKSTVIALTGAPMQASINGRPVDFWEATSVQEGDVLSLNACREGVKAFLCVSGGIDVPEVLGSRSTYELSKIGGFKGRKLEKGDQVQINEPLPGVFKQAGMSVPADFIPAFSRMQEIRVTMGIKGHMISDQGLKTFLNSEWTVSPESNRVAYRYTGAKVSFIEEDPPFGAGRSYTNVVDFAYPIGGLMFTNEEELIVLQNDATTGGGFVTIGTVISQDLDLIAQSRPLSTCRFVAITLDQAIEARKERNEKLARLEEMLKR